MGLKPLRDYQAQAVADVREAFRQRHRRVLLQLCTGGGKTRIMAEIARLAHQKGGCAVVMAPRRELVYQIRGALEEQGIRAGIIMAGHEPDVYADAHVCSIDTISSRVKSERMALPKGSIIITDEGHLFVTRIREEILAAYGDHPHLILTATPALNNGKGMGRIADHMVIGPSMRELVARGHLLPLRYFAPSEPDLAKIKLNRDGDYQEGGLEAAMDQPQLVGDVVDNWMTIAPTESTVVFAVTRKHSRHLVTEFRNRGITCEHVDGETPGKERQEILRAVDAGEVQVLCNVFVASYGLDIPRLSCAVIARPTKSLVLYLQMVGRVMRPFGDQEYGTIIDHAGAVLENGYADDDHPWSLDPARKIKDAMAALKKEGAEPKEIKCPKCSTIFKARRDCPLCGAAVIPPSEPVPTHQAELVQLDKNLSAAERRNRAEPTDVKRAFYAEILGFAQERGKSEGWAAHKYRARYGVWPNAHKGTPPARAGAEVRKFIQAENIRYARRREQ